MRPPRRPYRHGDGASCRRTSPRTFQRTHPRTLPRTRPNSTRRCPGGRADGRIRILQKRGRRGEHLHAASIRILQKRGRRGEHLHAASIRILQKSPQRSRERSRGRWQMNSAASTALTKAAVTKPSTELTKAAVTGAGLEAPRRAAHGEEGAARDARSLELGAAARVARSEARHACRASHVVGDDGACGCWALRAAPCWALPVAPCWALPPAPCWALPAAPCRPPLPRALRQGLS